MKKKQPKSNRASQPHRRTSIGKSVNTAPTNKHKRRGFKKYRGQG